MIRTAEGTTAERRQGERMTTRLPAEVAATTVLTAAAAAAAAATTEIATEIETAIETEIQTAIETAIETAIAVAAGVLATTGVGIETIDPRILPTLTKVRAGLPDGQLRQEYQPPEEFNQRVAEGRVVTAEVEAARTNRSI